MSGIERDTDGRLTDAPDRAARIFGNEVPAADYARACRSKARYARRFGDDAQTVYHLRATSLPVIGDRLGVRDLTIAGVEGQPGVVPLDLLDDVRSTAGDGVTPVIVGNIRMGFGHYRISMAIASAAHALGYAPYWLDLSGLEGTTCAKVISRQNDLYSLGSRLSQRFGLFNRLYWEPLNSEGFRKLSYNACDQKNAELMAPPLRDLPRDVPFVGTHVWPAQAAVHAGLTHVVNAIPDNWPMALHLAEGALHTVQTPSAYLGYRELRGMAPGRALRPMPAGSLFYTGHYVDDELVRGVRPDCAGRRERLAGDAPVRLMLSVGGAGAQGELFRSIIRHLLPAVRQGRCALLVNVGDHRDVWDALARQIPELRDGGLTTCHFDDFAEVARFADGALADVRGGVTGIHAFCDADIFAAVYATNLLMRCCDALITKPSELSFYPVPKVMIHRVGGHEAWGAIRAAEVGDGTYELDTVEETCAMLDDLLACPDLLCGMCDAIERNADAGLYDGAYKAVRLAVEGPGALARD